MSFLSWVLCDLLFSLLISFIVSIFFFFLDIRGTVEVYTNKLLTLQYYY